MRMISIVSSSQLKIRIQEEDFAIAKSGVITAILSQKRLPCLAEEKLCTVAPDTYVWKFDDQHCYLAFNKIFEGIEVKGEDTTVIVSSDNSLIRLIKGPSLTYCGRIVYSTNYPSLYIYPLTDPKTKEKVASETLFSRKVHVNENNIHTFVANRDDYLFNHIRTRVNEEFEKVVGQDCHKRLYDAKLDHWILRSTPGYYSYSRGHGHFAITAGEVVYTYSCSPVIVRALSMKNCYTNLPVVIVARNEVETPELAMKESEIEPSKVRYLEPITRRLFSVGAQVPCSETFVPKYLTLRNNWIEQTPSIKLATRPDYTTILESNYTYHDVIDNVDFSKGGIISEEEMKNLQKYMEFGRVRDAVAMTMANQMTGFDSTAPITPFMAFPAETLPGGSWYTLILGPVMGFLRQLGDWTSIVIALFLIVRLFLRLLTWTFTLHTLYRIHGFSKKLWWAFFGELFHVKEYSKQNEHVRKERLRHHVSLQRRYRRWKRDKRRQAKARRSLESNSDDDATQPGNTSILPPSVPPTELKSDTEPTLPMYENENPIEQQIHKHQLEIMKLRSTNLYSHPNPPNEIVPQPTTLPRMKNVKTKNTKKLF